MSLLDTDRASPAPPPLLQRIHSPPRKVAVLRASRLGDLLCAVPALRALRAALPEAEISLITLPILRGLAERLPPIDRYIPFPGFPGIAEQLFKPRKAAEFFDLVQTESLDLAIQMQGSGVNSNPFISKLGARYSAGFVRPGDPPGPLSVALPLPSTGHEIERVLTLTSFLGAPSTDASLEFPLTNDDRAIAGILLDECSRPLIGVHASSREPRRRWPEDRFAAVASRVLESVGGTIVLIGDEEAAATNAWLTRSIGLNALNLTARTPLPVLGAVVESLDLLITNDSGPAHIAYALSTPAAIVTTPVPAARYGPPLHGPFRQVVAPCPGHAGDEASVDCDHLPLVDIPEVCEAALELLRGPRRSSGQGIVQCAT
jgi:ADP-heptose:LPS heptosyltransferase